jgi:hypothetical protein
MMTLMILCKTIIHTLKNEMKANKKKKKKKRNLYEEGPLMHLNIYYTFLIDFYYYDYYCWKISKFYLGELPGDKNGLRNTTSGCFSWLRASWLKMVWVLFVFRSSHSSPSVAFWSVIIILSPLGY